MAKKVVRKAARFSQEENSDLEYVAKKTGLSVSDLLRIGAIGLVNQFKQDGGKLSLPFELKKRLFR